MAFEGLLEEHGAVRRKIGQLLDQGTGSEACAELAALLERHIWREEEDLLPLVTPFLPTSTGPVPVILEEHREIRALAEALTSRADATVVRRLSELISPHFAKEEDLLFPFAQTHLSAEQLARFGPGGAA
jgi:hemerythrin-like domain-containing protein